VSWRGTLSEPKREKKGTGSGTKKREKKSRGGTRPPNETGSCVVPSGGSSKRKKKKKGRETVPRGGTGGALKDRLGKTSKKM